MPYMFNSCTMQCQLQIIAVTFKHAPGNCLLVCLHDVVSKISVVSSNPFASVLCRQTCVSVQFADPFWHKRCLAALKAHNIVTRGPWILEPVR